MAANNPTTYLLELAKNEIHAYRIASIVADHADRRFNWYRMATTLIRLLIRIIKNVFQIKFSTLLALHFDRPSLQTLILHF